MKSISIKTWLILFLLSFAFYISAITRDLRWLLPLFIAILSAVFLESLISFLKNKTFAISDSAIISGLIIGYVISSGEPWWAFTAASVIAVGSKYLIRINKKHLFNPAAIGIFLATLLFGVSTEWKGAYAWYILAPFGIYFIIQIRKLELLLSYFLTALILLGIQAFLQKTPLLNIFGYLNYFFIFIMLIEPKTTPVKRLGKIIFGTGVALLIFILTEMGVGFEAELCALLVFNLLTGAK